MHFELQYLINEQTFGNRTSHLYNYVVLLYSNVLDVRNASIRLLPYVPYHFHSFKNEWTKSLKK
jgi:hypothetical protein